MPARLLLVDDEPRNLALLDAYLAPLGHVLTRAGGGEEALEVFEREGADLILLDVLMPDLDGIDVLTHVRAHERGQHVPVVLVTGQTEREARLRGFEAGADEFLEKPVDRALLLARVRTLLRLKEAGDEITRRNTTLERLQREQREMTAFIVHDLRNPLAIMHINLEWVKQQAGKEGSAIDEALTDALDASARLQKMLDDLLAVARIEQADVPPERAPVLLDELLHEVVRGHAREAQDNHVELSVEGPAGLRVEGDRAILHRVIENLVCNALRYTPLAGRISLVTKSEPMYVHVAISNTGQPIPEHQRSRIFEKFRRGENEPKSRGHSGLGLYFCRRAMEAHGGGITLDQTPAWPVSFVLRFSALPQHPDGGPAVPPPRTQC